MIQTVPIQNVSDKPGEFMVSGGSPPGVSPAIALIEEELAEIIAEALATDVQQFPVLEEAQVLTARTSNSPRGSGSRKARSHRIRADLATLASGASSS